MTLSSGHINIFTSHMGQDVLNTGLMMILISGSSLVYFLQTNKLQSSVVFCFSKSSHLIMVSTTIIFSALIVLTHSSTLYSKNQAECEPLIKKWTLWDGGLAATLKIPVPRDISSWNVQVRFNKHFSKLSFFNALSDVSEGEWILLSIQKNLLLLTGSDFSLNNESWSGNKKEGDVIAFSLLGDYVDQDPEDPIMINYVSLNDQVYCSQE